MLVLIGKIGRVEELDELASVFAERGAAAPDPRRTIKARRNAPCPCGSWKKFKKCCGATVH